MAGTDVLGEHRFRPQRAPYLAGRTIMLDRFRHVWLAFASDNLVNFSGAGADESPDSDASSSSRDASSSVVFLNSVIA